MLLPMKRCLETTSRLRDSDSMHSDYDLSMLFLQLEGQDGSVVLPHEYLEFHLLLCVQPIIARKIRIRFARATPAQSPNSAPYGKFVADEWLTTYPT